MKGLWIWTRLFATIKVEHRQLPAAVMTFLGLVAGLTGALSQSPALLIASWTADVLDGQLARLNNAETEAGARLDLLTDVTVMTALAVSLGVTWYLPLALSLMFVIPPSVARVSGRSLLTVYACWTWWGLS